MARWGGVLLCLGGLAAAVTVQAQAPKVGDITVGMSPQQVSDVLTKRGLKDANAGATADIVYTRSNGQQETLKNSTHIPYANYNSGFTQNRDGETLQVAFSPLTGKQKVVRIERNLMLGNSGTNPPGDGILKQLEETYGKPTHSYIEGPAKASLTWRWDSKGALQPPRRDVSTCKGTVPNSTRDDPQGRCGALALTVTLFEGVGARGPGVASMQSILVDYAELRVVEMELNKRIDEAIRAPDPPPKSNVKL